MPRLKRLKRGHRHRPNWDLVRRGRTGSFSDEVWRWTAHGEYLSGLLGRLHDSAGGERWLERIEANDPWLFHRFCEMNGGCPFCRGTEPV